MTKTTDEFNLHRRLRNQIHLHLLEMEERPEMFAAKDRLAAIQQIGMYLTREIKISAADESDSGAKARAYTAAFAGNASGGKSRTRSGPAKPTTNPFPIYTNDESDEPDAA